MANHVKFLAGTGRTEETSWANAVIRSHQDPVKAWTQLWLSAERTESRSVWQDLGLVGCRRCKSVVLDDCKVKMSSVLCYLRCLLNTQGMHIYQAVVNTEIDLRKGFWTRDTGGGTWVCRWRSKAWGRAISRMKRASGSFLGIWEAGKGWGCAEVRHRVLPNNQALLTVMKVMSPGMVCGMDAGPYHLLVWLLVKLLNLIPWSI